MWVPLGGSVHRRYLSLPARCAVYLTCFTFAVTCVDARAFPPTDKLVLRTPTLYDVVVLCDVGVDVLVAVI